MTARNVISLQNVTTAYAFSGLPTFLPRHQGSKLEGADMVACGPPKVRLTQMNRGDWS